MPAFPTARRWLAFALLCVACTASCSRDQQAPFLERFDAPAPSARWQLLSAGSGRLARADGQLQCLSPSDADACALVHAAPIDRGQSQLWVFALSALGSSPPQAWLEVVPSAATPRVGVGGAPAELSVGIRASAEGAALVFSRHSEAGERFEWDGRRNRWQAAPVSAVAPTGLDDHSLIGLEVDAGGVQWRLLAWGRRSAGEYSFEQGLRLFAMTDWVSWTSGSGERPLWLVLGDRHRDRGAGRLGFAWARRDIGAREYAWSNAKATTGHGYSIHEGWGYPSADGGISFLVQRARDAAVLSPGRPGAWDARSVKDPYVVRERGSPRLHLLYAGTDGGRFQIGHASAAHPGAPFRRSPAGSSRPEGLLLSSLPDGDEHHVFAPALVVDRDERNPAQRYKLLYTASDRVGLMRVKLATAPEIGGPWQRQGTLLEPGPAGSFDHGGYTRPRPLRSADGSWVVFVGARERGENARYRVSYATGPALHEIEPSGSVLVDAVMGASALVTSRVAGTRVEVDDVSGFAAEDFVEIDQHPSMKTYGQSRIRRLRGDRTLELYHGLDGFRAGPPTRIVAASAAGRIDVADVRSTDHGWNLYVTVFGLFHGRRSLGAFDENTGLLRAPSLLGPYRWDALATPPWTRGSWGNQRSNENLSFAHEW